MAWLRRRLSARLLFWPAARHRLRWPKCRRTEASRADQGLPGAAVDPQGNQPRRGDDGARHALPASSPRTRRRPPITGSRFPVPSLRSAGWRRAAARLTSPSAEAKPPSPGKPQRRSTRSYVLAISWQPAFCEAMSTKARMPLADQAAASMPRNFTLHGLWPQPGTNIYCGVSRAERQASSGRRLGGPSPAALQPEDPGRPRRGDAGQPVPSRPP